MPYYQDYTKKKMTRKDHLREESTWDEEGTRYRKSTMRPSREENGRREFRAAPARGFEKRGPGRDFDRRPGKPSFDKRPDKPEFEKRGPKPDFDRRPPKPDFDRRPPKPDFDRRPPKPDFDRRPPKPDFDRRPPKPDFERHEDTPFIPENLLSGRNPIREAIKSGRDIEKLLVAKGDLSATAREIVMMARDRHIPVQIVERSRLDEITRNHQGMLAFASAYRYYDVEDMLEDAEQKGEKPFLIILDGVTDPQNLGAIIRSAACVGAHGVIVPERRAVGLTPAAVKASAGVIEIVKVARVTNLARTIEMLKQKGVWIYAADMDGQNYREVRFEGAVALVIGAEGDGISRLTLDTSDFKVAIPMKGQLNSLNASVAAGILMYAVDACRG